MNGRRRRPVPMSIAARVGDDIDWDGLDRTMESMDPEVARTLAVWKVLERLDPMRDADWTAGGVPSPGRVSEFAGFPVDADLIDDAMPGLDRWRAAAMRGDTGRC